MAVQVENGKVQGTCLCGWAVRYLGAHGLHPSQAGTGRAPQAPGHRVALLSGGFGLWWRSRQGGHAAHAIGGFIEPCQGEHAVPNSIDDRLLPLRRRTCGFYLY